MTAMKPWWIVLALGSMALAQEPIYRCGNEYTNTRPDPHTKNCKIIEGGNVTVVQSIQVPKAASARSSNAATRTNDTSRDADARLILLSELKKAQARRDDLKKAYNNSEPEKLAEETHNHQKYLDRVAEIKGNLDRAESDIAGIQRELDRLPNHDAGAKPPGTP